MASQKVIVFGPTGGVGSSTALTAAELGAHVVLAMRDPGKSIRGLSAEKEEAGKFERIQADLTQPETVSNAVTKTGAKRAFIYLAHGMPNGMKSTIEALKSSGIELVVFLSSFTVRGDPNAIPQSSIISYIHAQVELSLEAVYGKEGFVAVRPGSFSSNSQQWIEGLKADDVKILAPDGKVDGIVPEDIGRVCGTVLAKGPPEDGNRTPYLYGPELLTQRQQVEILAKVLGKNPKIESASEDEWYDVLVKRHIPPPFAKYLVEQTSKGQDSTGSTVFGWSVGEDELANVEKYSGRKATTFEEWAEKNKDTF